HPGRFECNRDLSSTTENQHWIKPFGVLVTQVSRRGFAACADLQRGIHRLAGLMFLHRVAYQFGGSQLVKSGRACPGHPEGRVVLTESTNKEWCCSITAI